MRHYVKPECKFGCRFIELTPALKLCPHASYGEATYLKGAVEEARAVLEKQGGYEAVLARLVKAEEERRKTRNADLAEQRQNPPASATVRYG